MKEGNGRKPTLKKAGRTTARLRNESKRATDNAKKAYLENICNEIMEFQRTGRYDLMQMKIKEQAGRRPKGLKILASKTSKGIK